MPTCLDFLLLLLLVCFPVLLFPSLLKEVAPEPQGEKKSAMPEGFQCTWGFGRGKWVKQEGEGHWFSPVDKIPVMSVTSRDFSKAGNKTPNKTPNNSIFPMIFCASGNNK